MQTYNILQRKTMNVCVKKEVGMPSALPLCKPAGNALLVGAELRAYGIKQVNRTIDDVSHLFRGGCYLGVESHSGLCCAGPFLKASRPSRFFFFIIFCF